MAVFDGMPTSSETIKTQVYLISCYFNSQKKKNNNEMENIIKNKEK